LLHCCRYTSSNSWLAWSRFYPYEFLKRFVAKLHVCILSSKNHIITMTRSIDGNYSDGFSDDCLFRYSYKLGHKLVNGSYIWSKSYSFKSSPYPGQESLQRVVIFGDMGKVLWSSIVQDNKSLLVKSFSLLDIYIYIYIYIIFLYTICTFAWIKKPLITEYL